MKLNYIEILSLYDQCHGPSQAREISAGQWAAKMERKLGPDDVKFLIRGHQSFTSGMFLMSDSGSWIGNPRRAGQFSWGETAIKLTNRPSLEAIRIGQDNIAIDYKRRVVVNFNIGGKDKDG